MKEIRNVLYLDIHYQFFILLIYRLLNRIKISDEGFFYTCMYSIVFKGEKMTVGLNHFFFLNDEKCHESMECTYIAESILPVPS